MTIDEAYRLTSFVINAEQQGKLTADEFNLLAPIAQLSVINNRLQPEYDDKGRLVKGMGVNDKIREEFRPILKNPQVIAVSSGLAPYPVDYIYMDSMTDSAGKPITEAHGDEIAVLNQSQIKPPSVAFPKYVIHQNGFNIFPTSITSIRLAYLRKPVTPFRNYTLTNDRAVYNASGSQDFEIDVLAHLAICHQLLLAVGVNLNLDKVVAYAAAMKETGD